MGVKTLSFLGIVTSSVFVYICINSKKESLYTSFNHTPAHAIKRSSPNIQANPAPSSKIAKKVVATQEPEFAYMNTGSSTLYAKLSVKEQKQYEESLQNLCGKGCKKDIHFSEKIKPFAEIGTILGLVQMGQERNISDLSTKLYHKKVELSGIAHSHEDIDQIESQCQKLRDANYTVLNQIHLAPVVKTIVKKEVITNQAGKKMNHQTDDTNHSKEISTKERTKKVEKVVVKEEKNNKKIEIKSKLPKKQIQKRTKIHKKITKKEHHRTIKPIKKIEDVKVEDQLIIPEESNGYDEANSRIDGLLLNNPIEFNQNQISPQSRQTLDEIADIIRALQYMQAQVMIRSYTDASLGDRISKEVSQKRAEAIKNYLVIRGVDSSRIKAEGRGASELVAEPESIVNNRIEIEIKEGR